MSASPIARQACGMAIPQRKVLITDASQLPDVYSSTPGGTIFSTTPGGTRIVYERAFLMNLKNSPLSRTPPKNIPSHLLKGEPVRCMNPTITHNNGNKTKSPQQITTKSSPTKPVDDHDDQFDMDL